MNAIMLPATCTSGLISTLRSPSQSHTSVILRRNFPTSSRSLHSLRFSDRHHVTVRCVADHTNSLPNPSVGYTVSDFMTRKADLLVVQTSTTVDKALEILVEKRITGFPVVDADWNLVVITVT
nr:hypothetical protein [Tanacetum cinerariifolium]